jgi:YgiT-type zinc finger domain-containing protein
MICDICGRKGARIRRVTKSFGQGRSAFLIEGVPVVTCPSCGQSYMTAETLQEVERIRLHWRQLAVGKKILVARFEPAA